MLIVINNVLSFQASNLCEGENILKDGSPICYRKSKKMAPPYRVMLHNDNYNKREYVVQVLMKVIPGMTVDNAVNIMQEAHINGLSVVIVCGQPDAEEHCTQLRGNGLLSSIEPDGGGC